RTGMLWITLFPMASVSTLAKLQNLLVAELFSNVETGIAVLCSERRNFFKLPRAMMVPPAPVSTSNEALTRLTTTSTTRRFGPRSKFACLRLTTPKPSCFKKLFSGVGVVALFLSEGFGAVTDGDVANGAGVYSGSCAARLVIRGGTADDADACAAAIWIPHIATAIPVDMCSTLIIIPQIQPTAIQTTIKN